MDKKTNKLEKAKDIITNRIDFFFNKYSNKKENPLNVKPKLGKNIIENILFAECKDEAFSEMIENEQWEIFRMEVDGIIIERVTFSYDPVILEKLIDGRINFLIANSDDLKIQFPKKPNNEKKRKLFNKVWKRWTNGDLEKIVGGKRVGFDYSNIAMIEKEIDEIIFDEEPRLMRKTNELNKGLIKTKLNHKRETKKEVFIIFKNMPDILKKLSKKERRGAQIWKLSEGQVCYKYFNTYQNTVSESTLKRYLTEFRNKQPKTTIE
jgi:hypothetical protein